MCSLFQPGVLEASFGLFCFLEQKLFTYSGSSTNEDKSGTPKIGAPLQLKTMQNANQHCGNIRLRYNACIENKTPVPKKR